MSTTVIDHYEIRRGLGRGAMGSVFLAYDRKLGREVALKILQEEFAKSSKHRTRFEREARAIAALRHPNIVEIFDHGGSPDSCLYLVMELIQGPDVGRFCRQHGAFPESVVAAVGCELAAALEHAHAAGIIHRDLKPENVFIDRGRLVLADFGIVKAITADNPFGAEAASPCTDVIGTPGFMAPEQLTQDPLDERADIFSFGSLLYYLATHELPFSADSPYGLLKQFRESRPAPLRELRPDISDELTSIVHECLEVDRVYRPESAGVVRGRLRAALDAAGGSDTREILAQFEADPNGFREQDRRRTLAHLIARLKIAVRDQDGVAADTIRARLGVLDPGNDEALRITGVEQLIAERHADACAELVLQRLTRRRRVAWAVVLAVACAAALGVAGWKLMPHGVAPPPEAAAFPAPGEVP